MHINLKSPTAASLPLRPPPPTVAARHGIKAKLLIPGRGDAVKNGVVIVEEDKIAWVGTQSNLPKCYADVHLIHVPVVMPGLWDCHVHFGGNTSTSLGTFGDEPALAGARTVKDVEKTLMAGYTSVRELAGWGGQIVPAIKDGTIIGPNIYSSVTAISMTAGHGDLHTVPLSAVLDNCRHGPQFCIVDGVPECIRAVRLQLRRGAKVIKVCATGGVGSELDDPQDSQFSPEELKAIVDEAARAKRLVAAHCHGKEGIMNALNAGIMTIEHGSYLDEEVAALMKEKNAILVATRSIQVKGLILKHIWSPAQYEKLKIVEQRNLEAYKLAIKLGVRIALGTDLGISDADTIMSHGQNGKELFYAVEAGMTEMEAIEASTAISPETLGLQAPKSGQLKAGFDADIIAVTSNPLSDIDVLSNPDNVSHVWKAGKMYKAPS